jgi:hypothetical protein
MKSLVTTICWLATALLAAVVALAAWAFVSGGSAHLSAVAVAAAIVASFSVVGVAIERLITPRHGVVQGVLASMAVRMPAVLLAATAIAPLVRDRFDHPPFVEYVVLLYLAALCGDVAGLLSSIPATGGPSSAGGATGGVPNERISSAAAASPATGSGDTQRDARAPVAESPQAQPAAATATYHNYAEGI